MIFYFCVFSLLVLLVFIACVKSLILTVPHSVIRLNNFNTYQSPSEPPHLILGTIVRIVESTRVLQAKKSSFTWISINQLVLLNICSTISLVEILPFQPILHFFSLSWLCSHSLLVPLTFSAPFWFLQDRPLFMIRWCDLTCQPTCSIWSYWIIQSLFFGFFHSPYWIQPNSLFVFCFGFLNLLHSTSRYSGNLHSFGVSSVPQRVSLLLLPCNTLSWRWRLSFSLWSCSLSTSKTVPMLYPPPDLTSS